MNKNNKLITLLDILMNAKTRGAKTLIEAINITAELTNGVLYGSQMKPYEEYDYLMRHGRTFDGDLITEDSDIDYAISLLESPDYTIYRDMYLQALHHDSIAEEFGNE